MLQLFYIIQKWEARGKWGGVAGGAMRSAAEEVVPE
jgi:hypothetical protein